MKKGDPSGFINIHSVAKYQKNSKEGPFGDIKKFSKKCRTVPKKKSKGGTLLYSTAIMRMRKEYKLYLKF